MTEPKAERGVYIAPIGPSVLVEFTDGARSRYFDRLYDREISEKELVAAIREPEFIRKDRRLSHGSDRIERFVVVPPGKGVFRVILRVIEPTIEDGHVLVLSVSVYEAGQ